MELALLDDQNVVRNIAVIDSDDAELCEALRAAGGYHQALIVTGPCAIGWLRSKDGFDPPPEPDPEPADPV